MKSVSRESAPDGEGSDNVTLSDRSLRAVRDLSGLEKRSRILSATEDRLQRNLSRVNSAHDQAVIRSREEFSAKRQAREREKKAAEGSAKLEAAGTFSGRSELDDAGHVTSTCLEVFKLLLAREEQRAEALGVRLDKVSELQPLPQPPLDTVLTDAKGLIEEQRDWCGLLDLTLSKSAQVRRAYHRVRSGWRNRRDEDCKARVLELRQRRRYVRELGENWAAAIESDAARKMNDYLKAVYEKIAKEYAEMEARATEEEACARDALGQWLTRLSDKIKEKHRRKTSELRMTLKKEIAAVKREAAKLRDCLPASSWQHPAWDNWTPDGQICESLWLGEWELSTPYLQKAFPDLQTIRIPAAVPFGGKGVFIDATGPFGSLLASNAALRFLTTHRPGFSRLTVFDPVSDGGSVPSLTSLCHLNPSIIGNKVWFEEEDIERTLEEVFLEVQQKHRDALANRVIPTYAEPDEQGHWRRLLVAYDFPKGFSAKALGRLQSIMHLGPACGVQCLLVRNRSFRYKGGFNDSDFSGSCYGISGLPATLRLDEMEGSELKVQPCPPLSETRELEIIQIVAKAAMAQERSSASNAF